MTDVAIEPAHPRTSRLNQVVTLVAVIVPPLGIVAAMGLLWGIAFHWTDVLLLASFYVVCAFGTTIGYHRYFTHRGFEARLPVKAALAILGCMTMQGPLTQWVTDHRKHHALSDQPGDPHSPHAGYDDDRLGCDQGLRARPRRLAVREPRDGAGARVRPGSLRGSRRPHDRPALPGLGGADLRHPVRLGYAVGGTLGSAASRGSSGAA